jgi:hypothetical protein
MRVVNALAERFGKRADAGTHPMGHLWDQLNRERADLPALLALYQAMKLKMDEAPNADEPFSVRRILELVMAFRETQSSAEDASKTVADLEADATLISAINELLSEGVLDTIGPADSRLVWLDGTDDGIDQSPLATLADSVSDAIQRTELMPNQIGLRYVEPPGPDVPSQWVFTTDDAITVGREQSNKVVLLNPRVSRQHARIEFKDRNWHYKNLGNNGTLRSGEIVEEFTISSGDVVQLAASGPRIQFDLCDLGDE